MLALLDIGALDLFGGAPALRDLHAVGDAAHVELGHRRALAGMDVLGGEDDVELAVLVDDLALAQRTGDDLHQFSILVDVYGPTRPPAPIGCAEPSP